MFLYRQTQIHMKKLLSLGLSFVFSLAATVAFAQSKIQFQKTKHEFGTIKEDGGLAQVTFSFKNVGNQPLKLTKVQASCGCTTPSWTKDPIQPGQSGVVKAAYNPMNRPGKFNKTITVTSNSAQPITILQISGNVTPRKKGPKDWYPIALGNLRFKTNSVWFGDMMHDSKSNTKTTILYNEGNAPITLNLAATKLPKHATLKADKTVIQPKQTATLTFTFDASARKDWDYVYDSFMLITNDQKNPQKRMSMGGYIKENFKPEDKINPPVAKFDKITHNFGNVKQQSRVSTTFKITNVGKRTLHIRKSKASCGCTATRPKKMQLNPGESTTIDVTYSSGTSKGSVNKSITMITNDPKKPKTVLSIRANVQPGSASPKK
ncbi:MAG TPA: hypothetical protein DCS93_32085 [Microscillaceae bacterium]|nr:hypothetical protein [Microscillaceae bacterium]